MLSSEIAKIVIFEVNLDHPAPFHPSVNRDKKKKSILFLSMLFCQGVSVNGIHKNDDKS